MEKILDAYKKLPKIHQCILRFKALVCFDIPPDGLRSCINTLKTVTGHQTDLGRVEFTKIIDSLKSKQFLTHKGLTEKDFSHLLVLDVLSDPERARYLKLIPYAFQTKPYYSYYDNNFFGPHEEKANILRLAIYQNDPNIIETAEKIQNDIKRYDLSLNAVTDFFFASIPLDFSWIDTRHDIIRTLIIKHKCANFYQSGRGAKEFQTLTKHYKKIYESQDLSVVFPLLIQGVLTGNFDKIDAVRTEWESCFLESLKGTSCFLQGRYADALLLFDQSLKLIRSETGKKKVYLDPTSALFHGISILKVRGRSGHDLIRALFLDLIRAYPREEKIFGAFLKLLSQLEGKEAGESKSIIGDYGQFGPFLGAFGALCDYWIDPSLVDLNQCRKQFDIYRDIFPVIGTIYAELLSEIAPHGDYDTYLRVNRLDTIQPFIPLIHMAEKWERALVSLDHFFGGPALVPAVAAAPKAKRLAWLFDPISGAIQPLEQSYREGGGWSKGRSVALKRLITKDKKDQTLSYLTDDDDRIIQTLKTHYSDDYATDPVQTPLALVGHPFVFDAHNTANRLDLIYAQVELMVRDNGADQYHIALSHMSDRAVIFLERETPSRYRVIEFSSKLVPLAGILGKKGITVPGKAKDQLVALIRKAGAVLPVHSEVDSLDIKTVPGDLTLHLQLTPLGDGLRAALFVRPFGDFGAYFVPGAGRALVSEFQDGTSMRAKRSLSLEEDRVRSFVAACPYFNGNSVHTYEWAIDDPADCLEVISYLQNGDQNPDCPCRVEWPEGAKMTVSPVFSANKLSLNIHQEQDWLGVEGHLQVDEETVLDLKRVLSLLDQSTGRFIPLDNGKFLALTSHFRRQLQELKVLSYESKDTIRLNNFAASYLHDFTADVGTVTGNKKWTEKITSLKKAESFMPVLPKTLDADLRDYQIQGFEWLSRRSHLGMGACLADDMGLGKTLQSLAVMLNEGPKGPILVVAPTSVCHNWIVEIDKFAPALTHHMFESSNRDALIDAMGPMDVLVCSYTLLQQEITHLAAKPFQMVVLDESQSIKNSGTKRFQAAIQLQAQFKLALSGTPVENSLDDIWSLFRFIAPGLLGSKESFQKRFLTVLDADSDQTKRNALKNLIQFFILRRTKNKVLTELPPRIDQTILIDMENDELAFYEALRRQALETIADLGTEKKGGRKIHILSEIMRLRRACCHPSLVRPDIAIPSSKMKTFTHLIDDLLGNNHQALVFSQYVGYLTLIRAHLDQRGISYQYLDGSTPAAERQKQVLAFQSGKSPLFLLSLKAGGSGLNLTAADYVIHLDPWWNPAVEDQASDRAHRLGQTRPVTIYRLIMRHSIEEKILKLHEHKRTMADDLLSGAEGADKLSEADLIELLNA